MLIERMIQLPQENSIPGIVCILLERKRLSVIIFYESNQRNSAKVRLLRMLKPRAARLNHTCLVINRSGSLYIISRSVSRTRCQLQLTKSQVSFVVHEGTKLHSGLTLVGTALSPAARASGCDQHDSVASLTMRRGCQKAFLRLPS